MNFLLYVPRQNLTTFIRKYEIFKRVLNIHGSMVECGVLFAGGLMTFAQLSGIFEPTNHQRRITGLDTFSGHRTLAMRGSPALWAGGESHPCRGIIKGDGVPLYPMPGGGATTRNAGDAPRFARGGSLAAEDAASESKEAHTGGLAIDAFEEIKRCTQIYDMNRFVGHIPRVEVIRGDAAETIPQYMKNNPDLIITLLYLDLDVYTPTKVALEHFLPRMPKGGIIAFDELNLKDWPGETVAVLRG